jgi:hypothetical protein
MLPIESIPCIGKPDKTAVPDLVSAATMIPSGADFSTEPTLFRLQMHQHLYAVAGLKPPCLPLPELRSGGIWVSIMSSFTAIKLDF